MGGIGLAYYGSTELACVGSPRSLAAGLRLTAFSSHKVGAQSFLVQRAHYIMEHVFLSSMRCFFALFLRRSNTQVFERSKMVGGIGLEPMTLCM